MIEEGVRLAPPPGCPRMIYTTMIECWYVEYRNYVLVKFGFQS